MIKTNKDKLVVQLLTGKIHHPTTRKTYRINNLNNEGIILPGVGGITYNFKIGDNCMDLVGDHIEPGVSIKNPVDSENNALNIFSCIGNKATVLTGEGKGKKGIVTGKHGGVDHVIIYFEKEDLYLLNNNDSINIEAIGTGLKLIDFPNVHIMNIDPGLLEKIIKLDNNKIIIEVSKKIPSSLIGAGVGEETLMLGDFDIMCHDIKMNKKYNLNDLKFGDFVLIEEANSRYGIKYDSNYISLGVIVHSNSYSAGHGPGVVVFMTGEKKHFEVKITNNSNLSNYFHI